MSVCNRCNRSAYLVIFADDDNEMCIVCRRDTLCAQLANEKGITDTAIREMERVQEELLVAKRNTESWQETAQQAREETVVCDCHTWPTIKEFHEYTVAVEEERDKLTESVKQLVAQYDKAHRAACQLGILHLKEMERADGNYHLYQELRHETDNAIRAAEQAIERGARVAANLAAMAGTAGHYKRRAEAAEKKLEQLQKAGVTDYSKPPWGLNRGACHFCLSVWRADEAAKHKPTCPLIN